MSSVGTAQTALALALAALGKDGSGGGGSGGGTVSITVGTTTTGEPGTDAQVVNIGTSTDAIFNFVIPQGIPGVDGKDGVNGIDGIDGNMWYASNLTPGSIVSGAKDGDLILYNGGSVYQVKNGTPVNTQVSIQGSQWYFLTTPPSPNVPVGMQNGTILVFNDYSVWRITGGVLVNTGLNLKGPQGDAGFSPIIEVKEDTEDTYILTITTAEGTFDTPNLKGGSGSSTQSMNPYQYAVMLGYEGSKSEFNQIYMSLLDGIVDGGEVGKDSEGSELPSVPVDVTNPYDYAVSLGYAGTKEEFDAIYMTLISKIVSGGDVGDIESLIRKILGN